MQPRFENLSPKTILGKHLTMSFGQNKTGLLWQGFMPHRAEIKHNINSSLYSIEVYPDGFFNNFNPALEYEKWAGVEVTTAEHIPDDMEILNIPEGLYAIFTHRGPASTGPKTYQYIFAEWLPHSEYVIDERPHFALMTERYKHEQDNSEEDIFIPVKLKQDKN